MEGWEPVPRSRLSVCSRGAALAALLLLVGVSQVRAQPKGEPTGQTQRTEERRRGEPTHTAGNVVDAPRPGQAGGVERGPARRGEWALWIPRVILFPVRVVAEIVAFPVRQGVRAYEVYDLGPRVRGIFFNEEGTAGLYPVAFNETGFGLNIGGRLILRRLAGSGFGVTGRASFGGRFRQIYSLSLSSGDTWDRFAFDLRGAFEAHPKDLFFGIGNGDIEDGAPAMPLDPVAAGELRRSRFNQDVLKGVGGLEVELDDAWTVRLSGALTKRDFDDSDEVDADQTLSANFDPAAVTGFDDGVSHIYAEAEIRYDSRRSRNRWEGRSVPGAGSLIAGFAGYTIGLGDDPAGYLRYGFDAQQYIRLAAGPRVLALRVYLEAVAGDYDEVSFYDLPRLGGALLLRGHDQDLFRDRVAGLASAEYQFDLGTKWGAGFLFVDTGRVFSELDAISLEDLRVGFGGGIQIHTTTSFLGRLSLASSAEGGLFFNFGFDPVYDTKARAERK